jgi:hypothetical protein
VLTACFGTADIRDELVASGYLAAHAKFEHLREKEHDRSEGPFRPIVFAGTNADDPSEVIRTGFCGYRSRDCIRVGQEGWERTAGLPHKKKHAALVAHFVDGLPWEQIPGVKGQ